MRYRTKVFPPPTPPTLRALPAALYKRYILESKTESSRGQSMDLVFVAVTRAQTTRRSADGSRPTVGELHDGHPVLASIARQDNGAAPLLLLPPLPPHAPGPTPRPAPLSPPPTPPHAVHISPLMAAQSLGAQEWADWAWRWWWQHKGGKLTPIEADVLNESERAVVDWLPDGRCDCSRFGACQMRPCTSTCLLLCSRGI